MSCAIVIFCQISFTDCAIWTRCNFSESYITDAHLDKCLDHLFFSTWRVFEVVKYGRESVGQVYESLWTSEFWKCPNGSTLLCLFCALSFLYFNIVFLCLNALLTFGTLSLSSLSQESVYGFLCLWPVGSFAASSFFHLKHAEIVPDSVGFGHRGPHLPSKTVVSILFPLA